MDEERLFLLLRKNFSKKPSNRLTEHEKSELLEYRELLGNDQWNIYYAEAKRRHQDRRRKKLSALGDTSRTNLNTPNYCSESDRPSPPPSPPNQTPHATSSKIATSSTLADTSAPTSSHVKPATPPPQPCSNCADLMETHDKELRQAQADQDAIQDKLDTLTLSYRQLKSQFEELKEAKAQNDDVEDQNDDVSSEAVRDYEFKISSLELELERVLQESAQKDDVIAEKDDVLAQKDETINELTNQFNELQSYINENFNISQDGHVIAQNDDVGNLNFFKDIVTSLSNEISTLKDQYQESEHCEHELRVEIDQLKQYMKHKISTLEEEIEKRGMTIKDQEEVIKGLNNQFNDLMTWINNRQSKQLNMDESSDLLTHLKKTIDSMNAEIKSLRIANTELEEVNEKLVSEQGRLDALRDETLRFVQLAIDRNTYQSTLPTVNTSRDQSEVKQSPSENATLSAAKVLLESNGDVCSAGKVLLARINYLSNQNDYIKSRLVKLSQDVSSVKRCQRFIKELTKTSFQQMTISLTNMSFEMAGCWSKMRSLNRNEMIEKEQLTTGVSGDVMGSEELKSRVVEFSPRALTSPFNKTKTETIVKPVGKQSINPNQSLTLEDLHTDNPFQAEDDVGLIDNREPQYWFDSENSNKRVLVLSRFRSLFEKNPYVTIDTSSVGNVNVTIDGEQRNYQINGYFDPGLQNSIIFDYIKELSVLPLEATSLLYVAYGPKSSGKSYSLFGCSSDTGLIHKTIDYIFQNMSHYSETQSVSVSFCAIDVTSNHVVDLLSEDDISPFKTDKFSSLGSFIHIPLSCADDFLSFSDLIVTSEPHSSRTHRLISITFDILDLVSNQRHQTRVSFLDCAQSDSSKSQTVPNPTSATSSPLSRVSRSLAALGDVLTSIQVGASHIPFRNSRLTHILQDCLLPNPKEARCVTIAHCGSDVNGLVNPLAFGSSIAKLG
ncbi:hypothetical protein P9112_013426 [Eukaryota sp. TZLM1-RC]